MAIVYVAKYYDECHIQNVNEKIGWALYHRKNGAPQLAIDKMARTSGPQNGPEQKENRRGDNKKRHFNRTYIQMKRKRRTM